MAGGSLSMLVAAAPANAAFIQGSIGFTGSFTANGNYIGDGGTTCASDITATWSATLTANQEPAEVPAPAALLLLGASLLGLGLLRRAV